MKSSIGTSMPHTLDPPLADADGGTMKDTQVRIQEPNTLVVEPLDTHGADRAREDAAAAVGSE